MPGQGERMSLPTEALQQIALLTPLSKILSRLEALVAPVAARDVAIDRAIGARLAADIIAPSDMPPVASALRDGWAVAWERTADASAYTPLVLPPPLHWVEAGQPMPAGTDAVLPADAVVLTKENAETSSPAGPFDGVLPANGDVKAGAILRNAGDLMRPLDVAILRALGIETASVRAPRVKILSLSAPDTDADTVAPLIAHAVKASGGAPAIVDGKSLEAVFAEPDCDAILTIGGTGAGRRDAAVKTLARAGKVEFHGFGISPGATAALGRVGKCPVLMLPGRLDGALAAFLLAGSRMISQLCAASETGKGQSLSLTKKVTSTIGLVDLVLVRRAGEGIEPIAKEMFPMQALLQADGWIAVPAESEGLAAGTAVEVRELP